MGHYICTGAGNRIRNSHQLSDLIRSMHCYVCYVLARGLSLQSATPNHPIILRTVVTGTRAKEVFPPMHRRPCVAVIGGRSNRLQPHPLMVGHANSSSQLSLSGGLHAKEDVFQRFFLNGEPCIAHVYRQHNQYSI